MNKWLKIFLLIAQIGGGLIGLGITGRILLAGNLSPIGMIINGTFGLVFAFGILAGVALIKKERLGIILSLIFQCIQIPIIITPAIAYVFSSGAFLNIFWQHGGWGTRFAFLGSTYYCYLNGGQPFCAGVNIVALVLFGFLARELWLSIASYHWTNVEVDDEIQLSQPTESPKPSLAESLRS